jgi:hypothetical protein
MRTSLVESNFSSALLVGGGEGGRFRREIEVDYRVVFPQQTTGLKRHLQ